MLLDDIKTAARISHNKLNTLISDKIEWAKAELIRVGVPSDIAVDEQNVLISNAIQSGVLSQILTDKADRDKAEESFIYQQDVLRKHNWDGGGMGEE